VPTTTLKCGSVNIPVGGGGYFRLMPYAWTEWAVARVNRLEAQPVVFYVHPWELDPQQPRIPAAPLARWRHHVGLGRTCNRLHRMLTSFRFAPILELIASRDANVLARASQALPA
jgi:hypothetical protein